jgi:hypothetical protein
MYNGTAQTLPASTVFRIPSYYVYSDGSYPPTYPPHPNLASPLPFGSNNRRQYPLQSSELALLNDHVNLYNT